ncbi:MAG: hypothetical protein COZ74_02710 [Flavobacteriaceae bacterium CG_4_8_14_3_um_filter_31_8]|nr:MAG: hypothetical protein COZ74_02710 [Flavobacteriaceae bacterium CG_4_8_14_3_um_filter_31_8]PJC11250.1 MAG: hypothetical protein CO067_00455 [Flavobacteriaceae bacterium CG_4_9_14_0_8_um_filter_31_91]
MLYDGYIHDFFEQNTQKCFIAYLQMYKKICLQSEQFTVYGIINLYHFNQNPFKTPKPSAITVILN